MSAGGRGAHTCLHAGAGPRVGEHSRGAGAALRHGEGALNSLATAGRDARRWEGIKREFRIELGKRGPENGDSKHTRASPHSSSTRKAHTFENRPSWIAPQRNLLQGTFLVGTDNPFRLLTSPHGRRQPGALEDGDSGAPGARRSVCRTPPAGAGPHLAKQQGWVPLCPVPARVTSPCPPRQPAGPNERRGRSKPSEPLTPSFLLRIFT